MAQNVVLTANRDGWTLLTDADIGTVTFQNLSDHDMQFWATTDTTVPAASTVGLKYAPGFGESSGALATLFPGLTSPDRLWAKGAVNGAKVFVSHA